MSEISATLEYEIHSALFWSERLGGYGSEMSGLANRFALASALVSAATGATVWVTLTESKGVAAQLLVSVMAVVAAGLAMWPSAAGYAECAKQSAALSSDYGQVLVKLRKATDHVHASRRTNVLTKDLAAEVDSAIDEFQKIRARKESLRPYPVALEKEVRDLRQGMNIAADPAKLAALRTATAAGS